jgi:HAD superfamily hydrolase (TIGR01509 family)
MMKAVLFDFGGTIDTDGVHWSERFWEYYQKFKIAVEKKDFETAFVKADVEILKNDLSRATFKHILELQLSSQFDILNINREKTDFQRLLIECYSDTQSVIGGAKLLLKEIKKRYKLALVSNFYGNLDVVCREFGLEEIFEVRIDSEVVNIRKPDPKIFGIALEKLAVKAGQSYVVGDSYDRDIVPGKELGCKTIWLKGKSWKEEPRSEAADSIISSFEGLRSILLS